MEAIYALFVALAGLITLSTGVGWYLFNRLKRLEAKDEAADNAVRKERDDLRTRVTDLEKRVDRIPVLEKQVSQLITWQEIATKQLNDKDRTIAEQRESLKKAERDCVDKDRTIDRQQTIIETQDKALQYFGAEHAKAKSEPSAPGGETVSPEQKRTA